MDKIIISIFSALLGFALSQSFNLINYLRRPKFRVRHEADGVVSSYTGDPPETPWEIELGFFLENSGKNMAKNTRIFVSDIRVNSESRNELEITSLELLEIRRPIDIIPPGECILVKFGTINSQDQELKLFLLSDPDENLANMIAAETRGKTAFFSKILHNVRR